VPAVDLRRNSTIGDVLDSRLDVVPGYRAFAIARISPSQFQFPGQFRLLLQLRGGAESFDHDRTYAIGERSLDGQFAKIEQPQPIFAEVHVEIRLGTDEHRAGAPGDMRVVGHVDQPMPRHRLILNPALEDGNKSMRGRKPLGRENLDAYFENLHGPVTRLYRRLGRGVGGLHLRVALVRGIDK
jgi:hypothetical protein